MEQKVKLLCINLILPTIIFSAFCVHELQNEEEEKYDRKDSIEEIEEDEKLEAL